MLVVLAVMGYLGKGKVEELEIVQRTGTATGTVNAVETGSSAGTRFIVDASGGMGVRRDIGVMLGQTVLGWILVYWDGV